MTQARALSLVSLLLGGSLLCSSVHASETHVFAYAVDLRELARIPGSKDKGLLRRVMTAQKNLLDDVNKRYYREPSTLITAEQALSDIVEGNLRNGYGYEYRCVIEPLLEVVGQRLEDKTSRRSLWFNLDFWLDDFRPVMKQLGLALLEDRWDREVLPFPLPDDADPWPRVSHLTSKEVSETLAAFRRADLNQIKKLDKKLFTEKTQEDDVSLEDLRATMKENLLELRRWLEVVEARKGDSESLGLVLIFDGDR